MDLIELRAKINIIQKRDNDPTRERHGTANYLAPLLGFLNDGLIGVYGESLGCNDLEVLLQAAHELKDQLKSELSESDWNTYFGRLKK